MSRAIARDEKRRARRGRSGARGGRSASCELSFASAASAFFASSSKSWWRADDADVVEAVVGADRVRRVEIWWQRLQRALPLKSTQPAFASASIAFASPARKRSNGASRKTSVRSNAAIARADVVVVRRAAVGRLEHLLILGVALDPLRSRRRRSGWPISIGLMIGSFACSSSVARAAVPELRREERAFIVVGALRWPSLSPMPSDVARRSVKPRLTSWQVAQATVPSFESRGSK